MNHPPRYAYDCENCKFSWCCGMTCVCWYKHSLPEPPEKRKREVDAVLIEEGYEPEYEPKKETK